MSLFIPIVAACKEVGYWELNMGKNNCENWSETHGELNPFYCPT